MGTKNGGGESGPGAKTIVSIVDADFRDWMNRVRNDSCIVSWQQLKKSSVESWKKDFYKCYLERFTIGLPMGAAGSADSSNSTNNNFQIPLMNAPNQSPSQNLPPYSTMADTIRSSIMKNGNPHIFNGLSGSGIGGLGLETQMVLHMSGIGQQQGGSRQQVEGGQQAAANSGQESVNNMNRGPTDSGSGWGTGKRM